MLAYFACGPGAYRMRDSPSWLSLRPSSVTVNSELRIRVGVRAGWKHREVHADGCNSRTPQLLAHKP
jgi:hypothetical protein